MDEDDNNIRRNNRINFDLNIEYSLEKELKTVLGWGWWNWNLLRKKRKYYRF